MKRPLPFFVKAPMFCPQVSRRCGEGGYRTQKGLRGHGEQKYPTATFCLATLISVFGAVCMREGVA